MKKLAVVITHPIQYFSPLFKLLDKELRLKVFYTWEQAQGKKYDQGFGKDIEWDIPLLEGYNYFFASNASPKPGVHHFMGIVNPNLVKFIKFYDPDAILIFGWNFYSHMKVLRAFKGRAKIFFRGDSTLLDEQPGLKKILRRIFLTWIYRKIDTALYVGQNNKAYFKKHGLKEEQLIFAPHAIDNDRFSNDHDSNKQLAASWRQDLGITDQETVFLFVGKLESKKDPVLLIESFKKISQKATLILVGNGILEAELKERAKGNKNIIFIEFQNQSKMPVVYCLGDVFVLPSQGPEETWGLAVNEAMACCLPVLVSDKVGCAIDLVENGRNGFIFKAKSSQDLTEKLETLASKKKAQLMAMGNESQNIISEWTMDKIKDVIVHEVNDIY